MPFLLQPFAASICTPLKFLSKPVLQAKHRGSWRLVRYSPGGSTFGFGSSIRLRLLANDSTLTAFAAQSTPPTADEVGLRAASQCVLCCVRVFLRTAQETYSGFLGELLYMDRHTSIFHYFRHKYTSGKLP